MSIQALRERQTALNKDARQLLAEKGAQTWSAEDQTKYDGIMDEAERVTRQVEAHKRQLDNEAEESFNRKPGKPNNQGGKGGKDDELREGYEIFLRKSDKQMNADDVAKVRNTMSTTTGTEGGYTVQPLIAKTLIESLKGFGAMRRVASSITTETGVDLAYPTTDGTSELGEIVAQNASATTADVVFGTRSLNVVKFSSKVVTVPIELIQDSGIDVIDLVNRRLRSRIGRVQNLKYTQGSGTGEPMGLITAAAVGKVGATGQTATIIYDDLVDVIDSLDVAYLEPQPTGDGLPDVQPGWMFGQSTRKTLRKLKDGNGRPIWTPSYDQGIVQRGQDELMGYPVTINNDMPTPAANAKSLAFGSLNQYMVRDAMVVTLYRFDDSAFAMKGQVGFLAFCRGGGNLMDLGAVKTYQQSAT